ncbi:MAG: UbiA-like polyprenyltransferase [Pirellulaceae bacterium]
MSRSNDAPSRIRQLLEMIRFSHTIFALPFALLAAVLAWWTPAETAVGFRWQDLLGILLAMVGARSAAMAFNRLMDRHIDAGNPRTAGRHLPSGQLSVGAVWLFTLVSVAVYFLGGALFLPNWLPLAIAVPVLLVLLGYSFAKRFTALAHFWLGFALMLAPVCAWVALRGNEVLQHPVDLLPSVLLGAAVMFWVAGFDIIYACQDFEFDREAGLNSVPVRLGVAGALRAAMLSHLVMLGLLAALCWSPQLGGPEIPLGRPFGVGVALIAGLLVYEHSLVRPNDLTRVNQAFYG